MITVVRRCSKGSWERSTITIHLDKKSQPSPLNFNQEQKVLPLENSNGATPVVMLPSRKKASLYAQKAETLQQWSNV